MGEGLEIIGRSGHGSYIIDLSTMQATVLSPN